MAYSVAEINREESISDYSMATALYLREYASRRQTSDRCHTCIAQKLDNAEVPRHLRAERERGCTHQRCIPRKLPSVISEGPT